MHALGGLVTRGSGATLVPPAARVGGHYSVCTISAEERGPSLTSAVANIAAWTFVSECPIPDDIGPLLVEGEQPIAAYKTFRDSAVFTTKRLIVRDAQGLTGKKVEIYSLPYNAINMWSSENAARMLDFNSELELWTRAGHIKINLNRGVDIRKLDHLIAHVVLNG